MIDCRFQLLATTQKAEMRKDRKAIQKVSDKLREMQNTGQQPPLSFVQLREQCKKSKRNKKSSLSKRDENGNKQDLIMSSDSSESSSDEVGRLTRQRNKLLTSGAYTCYDSVIKELERKLVQAASN